MNAKGKKFVSLLIIFSLLVLSSNLIAKERRGANLLIQKTDGQQIGGELIAVKQNSLLLKDSESGTDVSVDIRDAKVIKIVGKSKVWKGALYGFLIGLGGSIVNMLIRWEWWVPMEEGGFGHYIFALSATGASLGALIGAHAGTDETIQIEGRSDTEIKEVLEKLRSKARIRDYK